MKREKKVKSLFKSLTLAFVTLALALTAACGRANPSSPAGGQSELQGDITLALPWGGADMMIIQGVMNAYMDINPKVNMRYKFVATEEYPQYMNTSLSTDDLNNLDFDIILSGLVSSSLKNSKKLVDYAQYLSDENPYYDDQVWMDTMDPIAYPAQGSKGEIFALSFDNTHIVFAYNKEITDAAGVDPSEFETWDGFVGACAKIQAYGKVPLAMAGDQESFSSRMMGWLMSVYVDQYFRDTAELAHAQPGDWNYNPRVDAGWEYAPYPEITENMTEEDVAAAWNAAYYNDSSQQYTKNELRVLKALRDDEVGPINKKYQNMLANIAEVLPKYTLPNFTALNSGNMISRFLNQDAAITLQQAYYVYTNYLQRNKPFEIGFFDFPPMSANQRFPELKDYGPDCDYTRSVGGALGSIGIINKNTAQTRLCIDFMKFWSSRQGQYASFDTRKALGEPLLTVPNVKGVEVPEELLFGYEPMVFKGSADSNPASMFAKGLNYESYTLSAFQRNITGLFASTPDYSAISLYGTTMQREIKDNMYRYFALRGYSPDCLSNVAANPFI